MLEIDNTCGRPITKDITSYFGVKVLMTLELAYNNDILDLKTLRLS